MLTSQQGTVIITDDGQMQSARFRHRGACFARGALDRGVASRTVDRLASHHLHPRALATDSLFYHIAILFPPAPRLQRRKSREEG
jgi:hypothetical protein